ncbi:calcium-binding protein [Psychromarinibacter sp. S121]|uniref:calcium-binding protein n=1 Tax=Psychromarinibacter sp. S121 TaxID=3415127 RepID=UPI003C7A0FCD
MAITTIDGLVETQQTPNTGDTIMITQSGALVFGGRAVNTSGADVIVNNSGDLFGGVRSTGQGLSITNSGVMSGDDNTVVSVSAGGDLPANMTLTNTGVIQSAGDTGPTIIAQSGGNLIQNSGEIIAFEDSAILLFASVDSTPGGHANRIVNTGTIVGGAFRASTGAVFQQSSIITGEDKDVLINSGTLIGDVFMGFSDDTFDGRGGTVFGIVHGGFNDDLYIIDDASIALQEDQNQGVDTVETYVNYTLEDNFEILELGGADDIDGTGNDQQNTLSGNAGNNRLAGGGSRDLIDGGAGDDDIDGGRGNDVIDGGDGNDTIAGRSGNDVIDGGEGDDFIFGGLGADNMSGGDGNDTLKGGLGSDTMDGGAGADSFVFTRVADSIGGVSDVIANFEVGVDRLDLTGLVSGGMDVNIRGGFTGNGQASLRTFENSFGDTIVFVDADGDGGTDMRIEIDLVTGLTGSDFAA